MVIDFEATCEENNDRYKHEIIEFPVILVNLENNKVVSYFNLGWVMVFNATFNNISVISW